MTPPTTAPGIARVRDLTAEEREVPIETVAAENSKAADALIDDGSPEAAAKITTAFAAQVAAQEARDYRDAKAPQALVPYAVGWTCPKCGQDASQIVFRVLGGHEWLEVMCGCSYTVCMKTKEADPPAPALMAKPEPLIIRGDRVYIVGSRVTGTADGREPDGMGGEQIAVRAFAAGAKIEYTTAWYPAARVKRDRRGPAPRIGGWAGVTSA